MPIYILFNFWRTQSVALELELVNSECYTKNNTSPKDVFSV